MDEAVMPFDRVDYALDIRLRPLRKR